MNKIMIVTDSCSDIRNDDIARYDVEVIPMNVTFGDENYQEGINISVEEFYKKLTASRVFPKTSQPSPELFENVFLRAKEEQREVLVLCISSGLSGTIQSANLAASLAEYEDHIHIVDTINCLTGLRLLIKEACKLRDEGKSVDEIINVLEDIKHRIRYFSICNTLEYFHKGGRLSFTKLIIGSLVGLKPFIDLDSNGKIRQFGQALGMNRSLQAAQEYIKKNERDEAYGVTYGFTATEDNMMRLFEKTKDLLNVEEIDYAEIGAASGSHIGPGASCVCYVAKEPRK